MERFSFEIYISYFLCDFGTVTFCDDSIDQNLVKNHTDIVLRNIYCMV